MYARRQRWRGAAGSMAEAYGWGKVAGMVFPWIVDAGSRVAGVDVYSTEAFYIPWLYAMSDQMGANVAGFLHLWRKQGAERTSVVEGKSVSVRRDLGSRRIHKKQINTIHANINSTLTT